ncbi:MAG: hypothetical protein LC792_03020 [Actinobacteria bacterium]|nr:hypothetical protein [Actinomycetota bacterium]
MPAPISIDPSDFDRFRHYHRIVIDGPQPDLFSELIHSHEFAEAGHTHDVRLSRAYIKVDQDV